MLEYPSIRRYSFMDTPPRDDVFMGSDNPSGADDQQETAAPKLELDAGWVVGFVDGEGCFSVSIHRNPRFAKRTFGWQLHPAFHVYQHEDHRAVLEGLVTFFGCGRIRRKGPGSSVSTYAVDAMRDLERFILPFFEQHPPLVKRTDFAAFAAIVRLLRRQEHFTVEGFERAVRLAYGMNANGKQRKHSLDDVLAGSSETARQTRLAQAAKIQSEPHGDMRSCAEMT